MSDRELHRLRTNHLQKGGATGATNQYLRALECRVGFTDLYPAEDLLTDADAAVFSTKFSDEDYQWLVKYTAIIQYASESKAIYFNLSVDMIRDLRKQSQKIPDIITKLENEAISKGYTTLLIYAD